MSNTMRRGMIPWRRFVVGLLIGLAAWLGMALVPWWATALEMSLAFLFVVASPVYWWKRGRHGARSFVNRHERKQRRSDGTMSRWDHMMHFSATAMRIRWAREMQPDRDLGEGSLLALLRHPFAEVRCWIVVFKEPVIGYSRKLGYSNLGWKYLPNNAHNIRVMGPRSGKSQGLMHTAVDHDGPCVMTSTRTEIVRVTSVLRERFGPVHIFDCTGQYAPMKWSVLSGCKDIRTADRRARDLMGPIIPNTDKGNWDSKAIDVLGPLMFLAAHKGFGMQAVEEWMSVGSVEDGKRLYFEYVKPEIERLPDTSARLALGGLQAFFATNDRTRTSISSSARPVLSWLKDPKMNAMGNSRGVDFDVELMLLNSSATVYVLGEGDQGGAGALMRAFVAEIVHVARRVAERSPGGRLDPALLLALDEVPLTCPGPINKWVADMGGRGIVMDMVVQQRGQLDEIWGKEGATSIMGGCHVVMFGAGCNDADVAKDLTLLSGTRVEERPNMDASKKITGYTTVEVPVVDPGKITTLQVGESLFLCRGRLDVIRTPQVQRRRDYRRLKHGRQFLPPIPLREPRLDEASQAAQDEFGYDLSRGRL